MLTKVLNNIREFCSLQPPKGASKNLWKGGFTLVELMVVIIIVNLLSGIAIPKCTDLIEKSREKMDVLKLYYLRDALNRALYESEYDNNTLSSNKSGYTACKDVSKANLDKGLKEGLALFIIQRSKTMPANYQGVHSSANTNNMCGLMISDGFWNSAFKDAGFGAIADIINDRASAGNDANVKENSTTYTAEHNSIQKNWWRTYPKKPIFISKFMNHDPTQITASNASIVLYVKWAGGNPKSNSLDVYFSTNGANKKGLVSRLGTCFSTTSCY
jgi:prepilin-type N-terminal cleavage/methylation domain-containing protein